MPIRLISITVRKSSSGKTPRLPITRPGVATPAQLTATRSGPSAGRRVDAGLDLLLVADVGGDEAHPVTQTGRQLDARPRTAGP